MKKVYYSNLNLIRFEIEEQREWRARQTDEIAIAALAVPEVSFFDALTLHTL